jgi:hypothetical protein
MAVFTSGIEAVVAMWQDMRLAACIWLQGGAAPNSLIAVVVRLQRWLLLQLPRQRTQHAIHDAQQQQGADRCQQQPTAVIWNSSNGTSTKILC